MNYQPPRDLRKYGRQTGIRLIIGAFILLLVVGLGLIYSIYGTGAAAFGLLCLIMALLPVGLILIFLSILEWIVKRGRND
jgi:hypothetical protein